MWLDRTVTKSNFCVNRGAEQRRCSVPAALRAPAPGHAGRWTTQVQFQLKSDHPKSLISFQNTRNKGVFYTLRAIFSMSKSVL